MRDNRLVELQAVKRRYEEIDFAVSSIDIVSSATLCQFFGDDDDVTAASSFGADDSDVLNRALSVSSGDLDDSSQMSVTSSSSATSRLNTGFIASPSRHSNRHEHDE